MIGCDDSLVRLFDETRHTRPPVYDADGWRTWLEAIGQVIAAFPTAERRWAAVLLVANDVTMSMPGLSLELWYGVIDGAVRRASVTYARF